MKSNCNKCSHKELCKYRDNINSEEMLAKIQTDYPFVADLDFSCKFFEKKEKPAVSTEPSKPAKTVKAAKTEKAEKTPAPAKSEKTDSKTNKDTVDTKNIDDQPVDAGDEPMEFEDIRIIDFGLSDDTTSELLRIGGKEMKIKDLKDHANRMSPKCKSEINAKLAAFHRSL
jgi:hypothetical protein